MRSDACSFSTRSTPPHRATRASSFRSSSRRGWCREEGVLEVEKCINHTSHARSNFDLKRLLAENRLVEAFDFLGGADAERGALVNGVDLDVQNGAAGDAVRRLTTRLFDEQTERRGFEREAKLGRGFGGGRVGEHTLVLGELLVHIRDEAARVAERVAFVHVVVQQLLVAFGVLRGAHVRRREDLGGFVDLNVHAGADPRLEGAVRKLATLRRAAVGEFVDAVVEGDDDGGTRTVKRDERRALVAAGGTEQTVGASPGGRVPDTDDGTDGPVVVDDGGAVERVPAHGVLAVRVALHNFRLFFGRTVRHSFRALHAIPHEVIRDHVHGKLRVTKGVRAPLHGDERRAQRLGDIRAAIEHLDNHLAQLFVRAVLTQDVFKARVRVLLLRRRVERRRRGAVFVRSHVPAHRLRRLASLRRLVRLRGASRARRRVHLSS